MRDRRRLRRRFKLAIVAATAAALGGLLVAARRGPARTSPPTAADRALAYHLWLEEYRARPAELRAALEALGIDPASAVWAEGNRTRTLAHSRYVMEADPRRGARLRPGVRACWYDLPTYRYVLGPIGPGVRRAVEATGGRRMPDGEQTTNSWGCRGPEPDPAAPLRVLVVGDSLMQGFLLRDDETPPERLRRAPGPGCSVLNAGVIGYSPEQYSRSVEEFAPRFRPHAVVVSLCANDVDDSGDPGDVGRQRGWLRSIADYCADRRIACLVVATPDYRYLLGGGGRSYPDALRPGVPEPARWLDLKPAFRAAEPEIVHRRQSGLYLTRIFDGHLSPEGAKLWAREVAREVGTLVTGAGRTSPRSAPGCLTGPAPGPSPPGIPAASPAPPRR